MVTRFTVSTSFWLANQTGEEETQSADASAQG